MEPSSALKPDQRNESSYLILINHTESNIHVSKLAQHECKKRENVVICFSQSCNLFKARRVLMMSRAAATQNSWMTLKWFSMEAGSSSKCSFLLGHAPNSSSIVMKQPYSRPTQARIGSRTS